MRERTVRKGVCERSRLALLAVPFSLFLPPSRCCHCLRLSASSLSIALFFSPHPPPLSLSVSLFHSLILSHSLSLSLPLSLSPLSLSPSLPPSLPPSLLPSMCITRATTFSQLALTFQSKAGRQGREGRKTGAGGEEQGSAAAGCGKRREQGGMREGQSAATD